MPGEPVEQVTAAVAALRSGLPRTGLTLTVMPLGFGHGSGTGYAYSCDPMTGRPGMSGVFAASRAGVDLLAGGGEDLSVAASGRPWAAQLGEILANAEAHVGFPVRVDFVVERGRLWVMAVRRAQLQGAARVRSVVAAARQDRLTVRAALSALTASDLASALAPNAETSGLKLAARGLGASPGVAGGVAVFSAAGALAAGAAGERPVLIVPESRPEDLPGLLAASAVVTERGGQTSHAAVVMRNLGRPCVTALNDAVVDRDRGALRLSDGRVIQAGEEVTVDGSAGVIYHGGVDPDRPASSPGDPDLDEAIRWLLDGGDDHSRLGVRVNADTVEDAVRGREAGALGVGLCRVEHMFLGDRHALLERALLTTRGPDAAEALVDLRNLLEADFTAILDAMDGMPVVVRLLDPPRHEFLPDITDLAVQVALADAGSEPVPQRERLALARQLWEHNPMTGVRGARLAILSPELTTVQMQALIAATVAVRRGGGDPRPELLIPMVSTTAEVTAMRDLFTAVCTELGVTDEAEAIPLGVMIETPRAALIARELAAKADFLSIGTNDLSSLVWGLSRDDAEVQLLPSYVKLGILDESPFEQLDAEGVGTLIRQVVADAREVNPSISIGVCGEHAAEEQAIKVFSAIGVDYISCAAPRIPAARLASARTAIAGN